MKVWATIRDAAIGWRQILLGQDGWERYFRLTPPGLVAALALFYLVAFVAILATALDALTLEGFVNIILVQSLWLVAVLIGISATRRVLRSTVPVLPIFVPAVYALIAYFILGSVLSLILVQLLPILWVGLVFLMFRLGRAAGQWSIGVSAAFGALIVLLLVGLPMTLYMVLSAAAPAA